MVEKATYAGGIGLASSILPGGSLWLWIWQLQRNCGRKVYQIAAAMGRLTRSGRKGEVLAIFGLALGGGRLIKAAGLLTAKCAICRCDDGASSNAAMLYSLGYAACRFYEAKLDSPTSMTTDATLAALKQQSENYLETAIAQAVMDQILVHMLLASEVWSEIIQITSAESQSNFPEGDRQQHQITPAFSYASKSTQP